MDRRISVKVQVQSQWIHRNATADANSRLAMHASDSGPKNNPQWTAIDAVA